MQGDTRPEKLREVNIVYYSFGKEKSRSTLYLYSMSFILPDAYVTMKEVVICLKMAMSNAASYLISLL